jgi:hypothetical protein
MKAVASAEMIAKIGESIAASAHAKDAVSMAIAQQYIQSWGNMAKEGTTVVVPQNVGDASAMVSSLLSVFDKIAKK